MAQSTSVNFNGSLGLRRQDGIPSGDYTLTVQVKFPSWAVTFPPADIMHLLRASTDDGDWDVFANTDHVIRGHAGAIETISAADYVDWGMLYVLGEPGSAVKIGFIPKVGAPIEITGAVRGNLSEYDVGRIWFYADSPPQALLCTHTHFSGLLAPGELAALALLDDPADLDTTASGATLVASFLMDDEATAHVDSGGGGYDMSVTGAGITASDVPYESSEVVGAASITQAAQTVAAADAVLVAGAASASQASQTSAAAGAVTVAGSASVTQASQTCSGAGAVLVTGAASLTQAGDALAVTVNGALAVTQAGNTVSAHGFEPSSKTTRLSATLSAPTMSAALTAPGVSVDLAVLAMSASLSTPRISATVSVP